MLTPVVVELNRLSAHAGARPTVSPAAVAPAGPSDRQPPER